MKKNITFFITTFILVLITAFCMGSVVLGMPKDQVKVNEAYFEQMEEDYVREVKVLLKEAGLSDAGVMLTHVRESDGSRVYTLSIHHNRYEYLDAAERSAISDSLEKCAFEAEDCTFVQKFF